MTSQPPFGPQEPANLPGQPPGYGMHQPPYPAQPIRQAPYQAPSQSNGLGPTHVPPYQPSPYGQNPPSPRRPRRRTLRPGWLDSDWLVYGPLAFLMMMFAVAVLYLEFTAPSGKYGKDVSAGTALISVITAFVFVGLGLYLVLRYMIRWAIAGLALAVFLTVIASHGVAEFAVALPLFVIVGSIATFILFWSVRYLFLVRFGFKGPVIAELERQQSGRR